MLGITSEGGDGGSGGHDGAVGIGVQSGNGVATTVTTSRLTTPSLRQISSSVTLMGAVALRRAPPA